MENFMNDYFTASFWTGVQNVAIAIIVFLIVWLIAKLVSSTVEKALKKTNWDDKLFNRFRLKGEPVKSERVIAKAVYYILLVVALILFFNILNLSMIANPLSDLISTFLNFIPAVIKAALILLLAWIIATVVQWLIVKGSRKLRIQRLFTKLGIADSEEGIRKTTETVGKFAFYLILLLFIPGVLQALNIQGVAEPFSGLLASVLDFIPKLAAAVLIFAVGWFVGKVVRSIVTNLLEAAGTEKWIQKLKLSNLFEGTSFAKFVGNIVFILILIPITISALEQLELAGITEPAIGMLHSVVQMLPNILIAIGLILVGIWLGKLVGEFVGDYLAKLGFNRFVSTISNNETVNQAKWTPSYIAGYVVQILIIFFLTVQALYLIQLDFLVGIATAITAYLPNVLAAVLILGVALLLASLVQKVLLHLLNGPASAALAGFAKYSILILAAFMAVSQLGIASTIVNSAFILLLAALALAFGLAFGLGGKDFAAKYLQKFDRTIDSTSINQEQRKQENDDNQDNQ
ncbi:mechanosensitive ion channel [Oceanobacillus sp. CFH 90083]|uniref:mechanosensitive ion channel n=1 Tax=Oceanobacillus sp. CFH 90083 TaxID=2592336 RepID=UPI001D15DC3E|nr:mechanosensitive ion channel [Oceanobacillus sp. CFH 90083]